MALPVLFNAAPELFATRSFKCRASTGMENTLMTAVVPFIRTDPTQRSLPPSEKSVFSLDHCA